MEGGKPRRIFRIALLLASWMHRMSRRMVVVGVEVAGSKRMVEGVKVAGSKRVVVASVVGVARPILILSTSRKPRGMRQCSTLFVKCWNNSRTRQTPGKESGGKITGISAKW